MVDESKGYKETRQFDGSALDLKLISYSVRRESFTFIVADCRSPRIGWLTKAHIHAKMEVARTAAIRSSEYRCRPSTSPYR